MLDGMGLGPAAALVQVQMVPPETAQSFPGMRLTFNRAALGTLPAEKRLLIVEALSSVMAERLKQDGIHTQAIRRGVNDPADPSTASFTIDMPRTLTQAQLNTAIDAFTAREKDAVIKSFDAASDKAILEMKSTYGSALSRAFGGVGAAYSASSPDVEITLSGQDTAHRQSAARVLEMLQTEFGFPNGMIRPGTSSTGALQAVVNVTGIAAYDRVHGEGAFVRRMT
ncbi:MAG: hypothetical protein K2Q01_01280, partial [Rickettsiales bacterium]|nr:hypothetical protein [Rickettsiales bacterium]